MQKLVCTTCGNEEYTASPRFYVGDTCTDCGRGIMVEEKDTKGGEDVQEA